MERVRPIVQTGLLLAVLGCGSNQEEMRSSGFVLDDVRNATVGHAEGIAPSMLLYRVGGAVVHESRALVAFANNSSEIVFADLEAGTEASVGGSGDGPFEFRAIRGLGVAGDSVVAYALDPPRAVFFGWDGSPLRNLPLPVLPRRAARVDGGWLVFSPGRITQFPSSPGLFGSFEPVTLVSATGHADTLKMVPGPLRWGTSERWWPAPFPPPWPALLSDRFVTWEPESARLVAMGLDGTLLAVASIGIAPRPVTERMKSDWFATLLGDTPVRLAPSPLQDMPFPTHVPVYTDLRGDDGLVWARRGLGPSAADQRWDVFTGDLSYLATLGLPGDLDVRRFSRTRIIGVQRDEYDVESLVSLSLDLPN